MRPDRCGPLVEGYGKEVTSALSKPDRQRSVHPKEDGRAHENGEEKYDFAAENRPKTSRYPTAENKQIDQEVARQAEGDQTGRDGDTGHRNSSPSHIKPPLGL